MSSTESIHTDISAFPVSLLAEYEPLSCLHWTGGARTWLCAEKGGQSRVIIKTADTPEAASRLNREDEIIRLIARDSRPEAALFPRPLGLRILPDQKTVLIRGWIPGKALETAVESPSSRPGLPRETAIRCVLQVLAQLDFLHHLDPPVLHRDIKPQNVILDEEGQCHLIDLDIARTQRGPGDTDTQVMGTRLTSPPEQYGFCSTDVRSDIYSSGVLLRYCLTGEYTPDADASLDAGLRKVIRTAAAFDPENRYQRVSDFRAELEKLLPASSEGRKNGFLRRTGIVLASLLLLSGAFLLGRLSAPAPLPADTGSAGPAQPSAHAQRGVTEAMFDGETALYADYMRGEYSECAAVISSQGMRIVRYLPFLDRMGENRSSELVPLSREELTADLDALRKSPFWIHSVIIMILDRDIESLEPFCLPYVGDHFCLEFHHCRLPEDPSPLSAMAPHLTDLCCYDGTFVPWASLDFLRPARHLKMLALPFDGSQDVDLSALGELRELTLLKLENVFLTREDLDRIGQMSEMETLWLINCGITDPKMLPELEKLTELNLG